MRVSTGCRWFCGLALLVTVLWTSGAQALDTITGITILPNDLLRPGTSFTVRVMGTNQSDKACGLEVFVTPSWTSNPKASPFPVDFAFPADFSPPNGKLLIGPHDVKALPVQFTGIAGCQGKFQIQVQVKPPQYNLGPPPPPSPRDRPYPPPK
jgi:hypothetical protein